MNEPFLAPGVLAVGMERLGASPHDSIVPALSMAMVAWASLSMWLGLASALRWAAGTVF